MSQQYLKERLGRKEIERNNADDLFLFFYIFIKMLVLMPIQMKIKSCNSVTISIN